MTIFFDYFLWLYSPASSSDEEYYVLNSEPKHMSGWIKEFSSKHWLSDDDDN